VHSCYVGQGNCGPAHDTDGRTDDAAALTDQAHAIRVDELLGREPEGPTIAEQCRSATGSRRAGRSRSPSSVRWWRSARWSCALPAGPTHGLGITDHRRRVTPWRADENTVPNSTLSNGAGSRWTVTMHFNSHERGKWASLVSGTHAMTPPAHASNADQGPP